MLIPMKVALFEGLRARIRCPHLSCRWVLSCLIVALSTHLLDADFLDTAEVRFPLPPYENRFESIAMGDGVIVAVGGLTNSVFVSTDRVNWSVIPFNEQYDLRSVTYGSDRFVIVGGNHSFWSNDGFAWSEAGTTGADLDFVTFTRGRFWAVGGFSILDSEDGESWRSADFGSDFVNYYHSYNPGLSTLFDDGTKLHAIGGFIPTYSWSTPRFESVDGETWIFQKPDSSGLAYATNLATDGSSIAIVAASPEGPSLYYRGRLRVKESNGASRSIVTPFGESVRWTGLGFHDGRFSFFCEQGIASTDSDFAAWEIERFPNDFGLMDVLGADDGWLAATESGYLLFRSYDAAATDPWEELYSPPDVGLKSIAFGNGFFLVLDGRHRLIRSLNGSGWTYLPGTFESADDLIFVRDRFFLLDFEWGAEQLQSVDGSDWSTLEIDPYAEVFSVAASPDLWVALGRIDTSSPTLVYLSADGIVWEKQDFSLPASNQSVTYGNGVFVSENLVTFDGIAWEAHQSVENICFCEGEFLAHDQTSLYSSTDGISWTRVSTSSSRIEDALKLDGRRYLLTTGYDPDLPDGLRSRFIQMEAGWGTIVILGRGLIVQTDSIYTPSKLANLSARTLSGSDSATQIAGFVIGGSEPTRILARGIGPSLSDFGVGNPIADPMLRLIGEAGEIARNDNWADDLQTEKEAAFTEVGAFQVAPGSLDAALVEELTPGKYTAHVNNQVAGTGVALAEIYQLGTDLPLKNLSCRTYVDTGEEAAIGGLVVSGSGIARFLVRAVGPGLVDFGVEDVLSDPLLKIHRGNTLVASNQEWGASSLAGLVTATAADVGAFPLNQGSADSALVIDLPPGNYTASVRSADESSGIALLEIYLVE